MALEAALLVNVSNTGWYGDSWAMPQHLQISHLRALEMQKPMAHSADTGISAFINAQGKIINRIEALTSGVITAEIQPMQGMTPYARTGDSWVLVGVVFIGLLGAFCQNRINLNRV